MVTQKTFEGLECAGERFAAVLGVEQSSLEAILLKRRIMGASWLSISKPVRVDSTAQVFFSPHRTCQLQPGNVSTNV